MGGFGSGRYYRSSGRVTTEETKRIDIRYLKKQNMLRPNTKGSLSWSCSGEPTGNINYTMYENTMILKFRWQRYGEDWQSVEQTIWFDRTRCNFGGERKWFSCPHCNTRVAILYGADVRFLCRHCYQLPYASQSEGYLERLMRKSDKISARLNTDEYLECDGFYKPKGMHWKTFYHLKMVESDLEDRTQNALFTKFGCYL
jgi:hypothetical protein